jgi:hypothetical protein
VSVICGLVSTSIGDNLHVEFNSCTFSCSLTISERTTSSAPDQADILRNDLGKIGEHREWRRPAAPGVRVDAQDHRRDGRTDGRPEQ